MKPVTNEELQIYAREMLFHNDKRVLERRKQEDERKAREENCDNESEDEEGKQGEE